MPATLAILSIVFVESIYSAAGVNDQAGRIEHKLLSILIMVVISVANCISTTASTRLNNFFVATKFISIAGIVAAGIAVVIIQVSDPNRDIGGRDWFKKSWFDYRTTVTPDGKKIDWSVLGEWEVLGHYSAALYGALWAYSGWDKVCLVCSGPWIESKLTRDCRRFMSRPNFRHRHVSSHSPSTLRSQQLFFLSWL